MKLVQSVAFNHFCVRNEAKSCDFFLRQHLRWGPPEAPLPHRSQPGETYLVRFAHWTLVNLLAGYTRATTASRLLDYI